MSVCEHCGVTKNLVRHHISYEPEITQMLCRSCHGKEHQKPNLPTPPYTSIQIKDESYDVFNEVKQRLEKKAEIEGGIIPRYTQSDIVKLVCKYYLDKVLREESQ